MEKWRPVEPNIWKPEEKGDQIKGVVVCKDPKDESSGISARYHLENENGIFLLWGCTVLDDRMRFVKIGDTVRITFDGTTKNQRNQKVNLLQGRYCRKRRQKS